MNLGGKAGERLEELGEAEVVAAGEPLGLLAAQRGHAGHERVRDQLLHRLHALGHRGRAAAAAADSDPRDRLRPGPAGRGRSPEPGVEGAAPTAAAASTFATPASAPPPLTSPAG